MPDEAAPSPGRDVVLVVSDLQSGGAQRVVATLANAWAQCGCRVTVVTLDGDESDFFALDSGVERRRLGLAGRSRSALDAAAANWRRVGTLRRAIRQAGAPVVVSFVAATNVLAVLATFGLAVRLVICERNDPRRQRLGGPWDWLRRRLYRHADLVTANSREALDAMRAYVPAEKLRALPNPLAITGKGDGSRSGSATILSVGRLDQQKGYDILLDAFARSSARQAGWQLAILGEGALRGDLQRQADRLGLAEQLEWRGLSAELTDHYANAGIFVMASRHEGMPNVVLEAMAMGRPVIVTDRCGGALDYVTAGESGLVVPAENARALAEAIDRLASDPALRSRLGAAARQAVAACRLDRVMPLWDEAIAWSGQAARLAPDEAAARGQGSPFAAEQQQSAKPM